MLAEFGDAGLPLGKRLLLLVLVRPDPERSADMVEDDRRLREGARQIGLPDDAGAQPAFAVASAGAHRRRAIDEFDFADRLHLGRAVGAVHLAAFDKDAVRDVVAAGGIGEQLVEQITVALAVPQMMM